MEASIWAVAMVKDEIDIIEHSIKNLYDQGLTGIVINDNLSTDGTLELLTAMKETYPNFILGIDEEVGYYQSSKMTNLAKTAAEEYDADFIIPLDADEIWFSNSGKVCDVIRLSGNDVYYAPVWHMVPSKDIIVNPIVDMNICIRNPEPFPVVAFKWREGTVIKQGNHDVQMPGEYNVNRNLLQVRHYQYRSFEQFCKKVRNGKIAYDATNLPQGDGAHWRQYGALDDLALWDKWVKIRHAEPGQLVEDLNA